jgi:hypothetical protein
MKIRKLWTKKFYNIGHSCEKEFEGEKMKIGFQSELLGTD